MSSSACQRTSRVFVVGKPSMKSISKTRTFRGNHWKYFWFIAKPFSCFHSSPQPQICSFRSSWIAVGLSLTWVVHMCWFGHGGWCKWKFFDVNYCIFLGDILHEKEWRHHPTPLVQIHNYQALDQLPSFSKEKWTLDGLLEGGGSVNTSR